MDPSSSAAPPAAPAERTRMSIALALLLQTSQAVTAAPASAWWPYDWSRFPAAWFGSNATHWESPEQIAAIGKYSMAILGWQHLGLTDNMTAVVYPQLTQMAIIKDAHPSLPVLIYCSLGWAFGMNAAVWPLMSDPRHKDFFLQSSGGSLEFSRTNCQQVDRPPLAVRVLCHAHAMHTPCTRHAHAMHTMCGVPPGAHERQALRRLVLEFRQRLGARLLRIAPRGAAGRGAFYRRRLLRRGQLRLRHT